jgi:hypothetical protein
MQLGDAESDGRVALALAVSRRSRRIHPSPIVANGGYVDARPHA